METPWPCVTVNVESPWPGVTLNVESPWPGVVTTAESPWRCHRKCGIPMAWCHRKRGIPMACCPYRKAPWKESPYGEGHIQTPNPKPNSENSVWQFFCVSLYKINPFSLGGARFLGSDRTCGNAMALCHRKCGILMAWRHRKYGIPWPGVTVNVESPWRAALAGRPLGRKALTGKANSKLQIQSQIPKIRCGNSLV